jgi:hypothetical protein
MKSIIVLALVCLRLTVVMGFSISPSNNRMATMSVTQLNMFSGAGAGLPSEDNPEEIAKMEQAAKAMGMSVSEYKLGISARVRLTQELDSTRVTAGKTNIVTIERDGNNPPKFLQITVTENGKSLGTSALSDELVKGLKAASELSRQKRADAQKGMMAYIGDEMKKLGA